MTRLQLSVGAVKVRPSPFHAGCTLLAAAVVLAVSGIAAAQSTIWALRSKLEAGKVDKLEGDDTPSGKSLSPEDPKAPDTLRGQEAERNYRAPRKDGLGAEEADMGKRRLEKPRNSLGGDEAPPESIDFTPIPRRQSATPSPTPTLTPIRSFEGLRPIAPSPSLPSAPYNPPPMSIRDIPSGGINSSPGINAEGNAPRIGPTDGFGYDPRIGKPKGVLMRLGIDPNTLERGDAPSDLLSRLRGDS